MSVPQNSSDSTLASLSAIAYGGIQATIISAVALVLSAFSLYESTFKTAELEIFVPPVIHYARDNGGDVELFAIPITITNAGARTGTVLSMQLDVEDLKSHKTKRYYSALLGEHQVDPDATNRSFAPLSIAGRETFTDTVRFYPEGNPLPKLVEDAGDFRFTVTLVTAMPAHPDLVDKYWRSVPDPVVFASTLPWVSDEQLGSRRITIAMHEMPKTAQPAAKK
jgi:hypothetical protein